MKGQENVVAFFFLLGCFGWVLRELGIIKDDYRQKSSIHWEACQCKADHKDETFWLRAPEEREEKILNKILPKFGLRIEDYNLCSAPEIEGASAYATIKDGKKYIIYDRSYFETISYIQSVRIMGHEVGHHYYGHTGGYTGKSQKKEEIEADEFSGETLARLGFELSESLNTIAIDSEGTDVHGTGPVRRKAIKRGWKRAW